MLLWREKRPVPAPAHRQHSAFQITHCSIQSNARKPNYYCNFCFCSYFTPLSLYAVDDCYYYTADRQNERREKKATHTIYGTQIGKCEEKCPRWRYRFTFVLYFFSPLVTIFLFCLTGCSFSFRFFFPLVHFSLPVLFGLSPCAPNNRRTQCRSICAYALFSFHYLVQRVWTICTAINKNKRHLNKAKYVNIDWSLCEIIEDWLCSDFGCVCNWYIFLAYDYGCWGCYGLSIWCSVLIEMSSVARSDGINAKCFIMVGSCCFVQLCIVQWTVLSLPYTVYTHTQTHTHLRCTLHKMRAQKTQINLKTANRNKSALLICFTRSFDQLVNHNAT